MQPARVAVLFAYGSYCTHSEPTIEVITRRVGFILPLTLLFYWWYYYPQEIGVKLTKTHKVCRKCNEEKTIDNFYINTKPESKSGNSWNPRCKPCVNKIAREKHKANPLIRKNYHLKYYYGITLDEYNKKFNAQNGKCAICFTSTPGGRGTHFYVDHNHITKKVRGLLCHNCNFVIGNARESTGILTSAIGYLEYWIMEGGIS